MISHSIGIRAAVLVLVVILAGFHDYGTAHAQSCFFNAANDFICPNNSGTTKPAGRRPPANPFKPATGGSLYNSGTGAYTFFPDAPPSTIVPLTPEELIALQDAALAALQQDLEDAIAIAIAEVEVEVEVEEGCSLQFANGFESGNLSGFTCSGNCPSVATSPIAGGKYSGNFDLTRNMATSYRTEVEMGSTGQFDFNQEYWIGFNYRYEDWAKDTSPEIAPIQIHNRPSSWDTSCTFGSASYNPFNMVVQNDEARIEAYRNNVFWRGPVQKKQWLNIVFHFKFSTGNDGFIEAWKDGVKLGRVDGPNQPKVDKCGKPMRTPYFKMGIYKWEWRSKTTQSTRRQLFIDDLKMAKGSSCYNMVAP